MRNIVLARIDDRLIHGQIVTSWSKVTGANAILIADDALTRDRFTQRILLAAAPPDIEVTIYSVVDAITFLKEEGDQEERLILLTKVPEVMESIINSGVPLEKIVLGGMGMKAGRARFNKNVSASPDELECMKRILEKGTDIIYQLVPSERPVNMSKLIEQS